MFNFLIEGQFAPQRLGQQASLSTFPKCTQHIDVIGSCSEANYLMRNSAVDESIGGSYGVTGLRVQ